MAKVLIVDDNKAQRSILCKILITAEHEVIELSDGERVVSTVQQVSPDLLLLDIFMPNQDGIETIMQMRVSHPELPIIAVSSSELYLKISQKIGAIATICKPVHSKELLRLIDQQISG